MLLHQINELNSNVGDIILNVIIVDDGSIKNKISDTTPLTNLIPPLNIYTYEENKGKGFALRHGVRNSTADFIIFTDVDIPYDQESMINVVQALLRNKGDLIIGKRDDSYQLKVSKQRRRISILLKKLVKTFLKLPVSDTQTGLKGFQKKVKDTFLNTRIERYLFDLEFIKLATEKGLKIYTVPVKLREGIVVPNVSIKVLFKEGINFIKLIFRK